MADAEVRRAARLAALVAVPLAVVAGVVAYLTLRPAASNTTSPAASGSPRPVPTTPVAMPAPSLSATDATICRAFIAALPVQVRDLPQRRVTAGAEQNAAFGDPPITVACGVTEPSVAATDEVFQLDGTCWYANTVDSKGTGTVWTTLDRTVPVAVTIPSSYQQPGQWTNEFTSTLISSVPSKSSKYCG